MNVGFLWATILCDLLPFLCDSVVNGFEATGNASANLTESPFFLETEIAF